MGIKRWVIKRVVFRRLWKLFRTNEEMEAVVKFLQGKKTIIASVFGAGVAVLSAFGEDVAAEQVGQLGDAVSSGDPKTMLMAAAAFLAFAFDRLGRKREHEERLEAEG